METDAGTRPQAARRLAAAVLSTALLFLAQPPHAAAQASPDASCPGPSDSVYSSGAGGNGRYAQTFTALASGALTMAQADIWKPGGTPGDFVMHINEVGGAGTPTNTVLSSATIPDGAVPTSSSATTVTGVFASPATVTAGQQYALVVTRPGSDTLGVGLRSGNVCPGQAFESFSQTGSFGEISGADIPFAVFVEPPAPPTPDTTAAQITGAAADPKKFAVDKKGPAETEVPLVAKGTTFRYALTEPAQVKFSIFRQVKKKGKKKLKPVGAFTAQGEGGQNAKPFSGKIGSKKLKPGKHVANLTATDAAGNVSAPATIKFKVVKAKK